MKVFSSKKSIKQIVSYTAAMLLFLFAALPAMALEATSTSSNYRGQSSAMQQKISALGSTANPIVLMPVLFGIGINDISANFGDPRLGGRLHEGEDIMAAKGTPIISPTPAVVLRAGTGGTEGIYVYTANPGGETFVYMHLDRIGEGIVPGLVLSQGSLIGYVGNTGNAIGGAAHLHLEIHNSSEIPMDPFPRLTGEFSLQEKISSLSRIFTQTSERAALSQFLVTNFRKTFVAALAANITLPLPIMNALASVPETSVPIKWGESLSAGDLDVGSSGSAVIALQKYLIQSASGAAATRLATAGATGYFGAITKSALIEFQAAVKIYPSSGYYGPITRAFIAAHPIGTSQTPVPSTPSTGNIVLARDLYRTITGEDVRSLQRLLNANGFNVASAGLGSPGNETTYFGLATEAAVIRFQIAQGIKPVAGYVGPITRAALNTL
ncbi:MAG: hypothetical protein E4H47_01495 [Parcubacteria group bacterium]|nr:MAG: hypothetical protein E4H47_01495 [Parcubacteria group bacterium]